MKLSADDLLFSSTHNQQKICLKLLEGAYMCIFFIPLQIAEFQAKQREFSPNKEFARIHDDEA